MNVDVLIGVVAILLILGVLYRVRSTKGKKVKPRDFTEVRTVEHDRVLRYTANKSHWILSETSPKGKTSTVASGTRSDFPQHLLIGK